MLDVEIIQHKDGWSVTAEEVIADGSGQTLPEALDEWGCSLLHWFVIYGLAEDSELLDEGVKELKRKYRALAGMEE